MAEVRQRPLTDVAGEVIGDVQRLIRDEVRLARVEVSQNIRAAVVGVAGFAVAGGLALLGGAFLGVAAYAALLLVIPGWAAGLAVAVGFLILAAIGFAIGRARLRPSQLVPEQTIQSLEEDRDWLERRMR